MEIKKISELLSENTYPGRGLVIGKTPDGRHACTAYFIMGRSENSRNRIFVKKEEALFTAPFDEAKVKDPSLIIYAAMRSYGNHLVVTNGDQTDTICNGLTDGISFTDSLKTRCFEPDAPNFTPRISGILNFEASDLTYQMSILKCIDHEGVFCSRQEFAYPSIQGMGHLLHTYRCDGDPIPSFEGEPLPVMIPDSLDDFTDEVWNSLNADNKISLYVRYTDLDTGKYEERIVNKNMR